MRYEYRYLVQEGSDENETRARVLASTFSIQFELIDTDGATAEVVGPYGASSIIVRQTGDYLHLVQMFMVGPLYTTTVIDRETSDGKLMAVHTRHEYTDTSLLVSLRVQSHRLRQTQQRGRQAASPAGRLPR